MSEVKKTLKRLALYLLLLALTIFHSFGIIPQRFPTWSLSSIYLMFLCTCLILYYTCRVVRPGWLKRMLTGISWMLFLFMFLRGVKYSIFIQVDILARYTWYLFYVPMLLMPLFFFYISLLVSEDQEETALRMWRHPLWITLVLIFLVLTNDFHHQAFRFHLGLAYWDSASIHGWVFYCCTAWQYLLYFISVLILVKKCSISTSKQNAWLILLPFTMGISMLLLHLTKNMVKLNGEEIVEFPEILCWMVACVLECCIQLGLIPTNEGYSKLFRFFSISIQITDQFGKPVYKSAAAAELTKEQIFASKDLRIGEHSILHRMEIPGGFGFWQDDVTELDRLNAELAEIRNKLSEEAKLTRLQNTLREKQAKIEQRTLLYDTIARRIRGQSQEISRIAQEARNSSDKALKDSHRKRILLLGAYIKRYANLMLLSEVGQVIEAGELGLSVAEVLRYLNLCGIPAEIMHRAQGKISANAAITVFEAFKTLLDTDFSSLQGVFSNFYNQEGIVFKLTLENLCASLSASMEEKLSGAGITTTLECEDNVTYVCFFCPPEVIHDKL